MSDEAEIDVEAASALIADGAQLIDVRTQDEWDGSRLDGATHIPVDQLTARAAELDKATTILFYCHSGMRSRMAADAFRAGGYDAYTMTGGIKAWSQAGHPIDPPDGQIVH